MRQKEEALQIASKNNGVLLTKQITKAGLPRSVLKDLVNDGLIALVQRGVYIAEGGYVDDFFLLQQRLRKGVFSHETALYLLGFSDRAPIQIVMSFEYGQSTPRIKKEGVRPVMVSNDFDAGIIEINRHGMNVRVYEIERTLVDLIKPKYDVDNEQLIPALKKYAKYDKRNINKLYSYARKFGVEEKIQNYMGVLL